MKNIRAWMLPFLYRWKYILFFIATEMVLFLTNYKPGTYLVGWDNVYPELNILLNLKRNLFAVWQEYRGLGVVDGMGHAALLVHTILIWSLSILLPEYLIRWMVHALLHLAGGIGVFFLLQQYILGKHKQKLSFVGGLFYQFNLITIQMFFTPLEAFSFHFALLPWLLFTLIQFLNAGHKKALMWFVVISLIATPQGHIPPIFLVYVLAAGVFIFHSLREKSYVAMKRALIAIGSIVVINAFWLLPYLYTIFTGASTIVDSKINQMSTENIILRNREFGDFTSVSFLWGFPLNYIDFQNLQFNNFMMMPWRLHIWQFFIIGISFLFFMLTVFGITRVIVDKRKNIYPFVFLFMFSFILLGNEIPGISSISQFILNSIPLFSDAFRFVFTKFSILYALCYTVLMICGLAWIIDRIKKDVIVECIIGLSIATIALYSFPAFSGHFYYDNIKLKIPKEYGEMVSYFNDKSDSVRIATLPQSSFWGWTYNNWGHRGSGFIWYGIPQPQMDGAFYPWSNENENYYWEISRAVYAADVSLFESVLEKYDITDVVVDRSVISPFTPKAVYADRIHDLISQTKNLTKSASFGTIDIYSVRPSLSKGYAVTLIRDLPTIGPSYDWNDFDKAFVEYQDYTVSSSSSGTIYYPFRSLFSGRAQSDLEYAIKEDERKIYFTSTLPVSLVDTTLFIPRVDLLAKEQNVLLGNTQFSTQVYINGEIISDTSIEKKVQFESSTIPIELLITVPKIKQLYSYESTIEELELRDINSCGELTAGLYSREKVKDAGKDLLKFRSIDSGSCLTIALPEFPHRYGYLVGVTTKNEAGRGFLFSLVNNNSQRGEIETYLPSESELVTSYFVVPPMEVYTQGYTLQLNNESIGRAETINYLESVHVYPIPYHFLTSAKILSENTARATHQTDAIISVTHPNYSSYIVQVDPSKVEDNTTLVLSQSFDEGWRAYQVKSEKLKVKSYLNKLFPMFFGEELTEHVLVNNWANGWKLANGLQLTANSKTEKNAVGPSETSRQPSAVSIAVIFWPQYLEYIGFGLLILGLLYMFRYKAVSGHHEAHDLKS